MPKELLVVDDEPKIAQALKAYFQDKGFHVTTASSAHEVFEYIHQTPAEVVLLDLKLPDGSGLDILATLKTQYPQLRVIVISGLSDPFTIHEAIQRGANDYLTKPFEFSRCFYAAMGIETVDLTMVDPQPEALGRVDAATAWQHRILPMRFHDQKLYLVVADPLDSQQLGELRQKLGCEVIALTVIAGDLPAAIQKWYGPAAEEIHPQKAQSVKKGIRKNRASSPDTLPTSVSVEPADKPKGTPSVMALVNEIIQKARKDRATDLHLGMDRDGPWIRERIDGVFTLTVPSSIITHRYSEIVSYLKKLAVLEPRPMGMGPPQTGRIRYEEGETSLDLRLHVVPTLHGEQLAIRILEPSRLPPLTQLGLTDEQRSQVESLLNRSNGLFLITGPAGSGKSTTIASFLQYLTADGAYVMSIEDPIEYELPGVVQVPVGPHLGLTIADGLRAVIRHEPDAIMIGELRDSETALLAIRAALTGRLVLAALHTRDASSAITRLLDFGIEPFMLCATLSGILSQRLVRMLCQGCRKKAQMDPAQLQGMGVTFPAQSAAIPVWQARGCDSCRQSGFQGRIGLFELLLIDHHIRALMIKRTASAQIRQSAISRGMQILWNAGWRKAESGLTSLQELMRVLPPEVR